ncbi:MAG: glycosyltransferase family 9 protein [Thermodesulfobacteriota bacterium]
MAYPKILVLRLSAVGDVLRTLPAVMALRKHLPSSHIAWVVEEPSKTLLESQPEIDQVIQFPRKRWTEGAKSIRTLWKALRETAEFIVALRKQKFDIVLDFHGILKSGLISFFSGSPKRIGYDRTSSKEGNFLFSNIKVKLPQERISRYQRNFGLLKGLGLEVKHFETRLHIPQRDREYVESFFLRLNRPLRRPSIAIHAGTNPKAAFKRWMPDRYAQLADRLVRELDATIIFTWGLGELESVKAIQNEMKEKSILAPKTETLTQLGELLRRCDLYVGGDTGPMHIASLMGTPVLVIYGPTDPVLNEPLGRHKKVIREVGCNPCRNRSCKELKCLKSITVEDVFKATKEMLSLTN